MINQPIRQPANAREPDHSAIARRMAGRSNASARNKRLARVSP
jgi:hypothetical protein